MRDVLKSYLSADNIRRARDFFLAEYAVLIAIGLASALVYAFFQIADEVSERETRELDIAILELFRIPGDPSQMIGSFWFQEAVRDVTALGSMSVLAFIIASVVIYLCITYQARAGLLVAGSVIGGWVLSTLLKSLFDRPRPEYSAIAEALSASFPSGHAMLSAVTYLTLGGCWRD